jgi:hypothetical protein
LVCVILSPYIWYENILSHFVLEQRLKQSTQLWDFEKLKESSVRTRLGLSAQSGRRRKEMLQVTKPTVSAAVKKQQQQKQLQEERPMPEIITGNETVSIAYRNCIGCGFVYPLAEYDVRDSCGFCKRPLSSKNRKENRRRREDGEDEEGLAKAEALKERLVNYDRESAARTRVTDDDQV